jgi:hypothetical protein
VYQAQSKDDMTHELAHRISQQESLAKPVTLSLKKQLQQAQATSPVSTMRQAQTEDDIGSIKLHKKSKQTCVTFKEQSPKSTSQLSCVKNMTSPVRGSHKDAHKKFKPNLQNKVHKKFCQSYEDNRQEITQEKSEKLTKHLHHHSQR